MWRVDQCQHICLLAQAVSIKYFFFLPRQTVCIHLFTVNTGTSVFSISAAAATAIESAYCSPPMAPADPTLLWREAEAVLEERHVRSLSPLLKPDSLSVPFLAPPLRLWPCLAQTKVEELIRIPEREKKKINFSVYWCVGPVDLSICGVVALATC